MKESKRCAMCGKRFKPRRSDANFCSATCRNNWNNQRRSITARFNSMIEYIDNMDVPESLESHFIDKLRELEKECRRVNTRTGTEKQEKLI